jgi:hypothetical protein
MSFLPVMKRVNGSLVMNIGESKEMKSGSNESR